MAFSGGYGMSLNLGNIPTGDNIISDDFLMFSESNSRFLVEVNMEDQEAFEDLMVDVSIGYIGVVTDTPKFIITGQSGKRIVESSIDDLKSAWQTPLHS